MSPRGSTPAPTATRATFPLLHPRRSSPSLQRANGPRSSAMLARRPPLSSRASRRGSWASASSPTLLTSARPRPLQRRHRAEMAQPALTAPFLAQPQSWECSRLTFPLLKSTAWRSSPRPRSTSTARVSSERRPRLLRPSRTRTSSLRPRSSSSQQRSSRRRPSSPSETSLDSWATASPGRRRLATQRRSSRQVHLPLRSSATSSSARSSSRQSTTRRQSPHSRDGCFSESWLVLSPLQGTSRSTSSRTASHTGKTLTLLASMHAIAWAASSRPLPSLLVERFAPPWRLRPQRCASLFSSASTTLTAHST